MARIRLQFVLLLIVTSTLAQTFQYSRGWTNGKKRTDPNLIQQQKLKQLHGRPVLPIDYISTPMEDWSRVKTNEEVNEDEGDRLVNSNQCAKLVALLDSVLKNNDKTSDDAVINVH